MKVCLHKGAARHRMRLYRDDGSAESAELGPDLPYHDLAHYVVERRFEIAAGFYGHIARGSSVGQLSTTPGVRALGPEALKAEILARCLQALLTGACSAEGFTQLTHAEFSQWGIPPLSKLSPEMLDALLAEYRALIERYAALRPGESLQLEFAAPAQGEG